MNNYVKIFIYFISFIVVGAVAAWLVFEIVDFEEKTEVPSLTGKSISDAEEILKTKNLFLVIEDEEYSEEVDEGHIIRQNIEPGKKVMIGTDIIAVMSKGSEIYTMPSFEGQRMEDAQLTLENLGIKIKKITKVHSDTVEEGKIIAQRPLPGNIDSNEINFLVSLGPYEVSYRCPSFVNMTIDDARTLAGELGITLIEKDRGSKVIFQKPEAGALIKKGDSVEVRLGRGWGIWF